MAPTPARWLRPYELARKHGVELQTIYRWIREGKIPPSAWRKVPVTVERIEINPEVKLKRDRAA